MTKAIRMCAAVGAFVAWCAPGAAQTMPVRDMTQLPVVIPNAEVAPGVHPTIDPEVFVLRNASTGAGPDGAADGCELSPPLKHWTGPTQVACQCFAIGEEAGVVFEAPPSHYPIDVMKVIIAWGTAGQICDPIVPDLQAAINFYRAGLPFPGLGPNFVLEAPALYCGAFNQFDIPMLGFQPFRVNSGKFTVTLEFDSFTNQLPYERTVVHDGNGCQSGKNVVRAVPTFGWFDACQLGVSGDWLFEVVYRRVNCPCPGDINGDRMVDFFDLNGVLSQYGFVGPNLQADVNGDGRVDFVDLNIVVSAFGSVC